MTRDDIERQLREVLRERIINSGALAGWRFDWEGGVDALVLVVESLLAEARKPVTLTPEDVYRSVHINWQDFADNLNKLIEEKSRGPSNQTH